MPRAALAFHAFLLLGLAAGEPRTQKITRAELLRKLREVTTDFEQYKAESAREIARVESLARSRGLGQAPSAPRRAQEDTGFAAAVADLQGAMNHMWLLLCGALVMFMQAGFAMVEAGCCRSKNVQNILMKNLTDVCAGTICWWAFGWMFAYGPIEGLTKFAGNTEYFGHDFMAETSVGVIVPTDKPRDWFFQWAFCSAAATIVSGGIAERVNFPGYFLYTLWMTCIIYPVVVGWTWSGNGWLQGGTGQNINDVGYVDFAGSGIVHMCGGVGALVGASVVGARTGRWDPERQGEFDPHSLPLIVLGTFILWFGSVPICSQSLEDLLHVLEQCDLAMVAGMINAPLLENDALPQATAPQASAVQLGVLSEGYAPDAKSEHLGDQRVSIVPDIAAELIKDGYSVIVETGAGAYAGFSNDAYEAVGCRVLERRDVMAKAQVLFAIMPPAREFHLMREKVVISWVGRLQDKGKELVDEANSNAVTLVDVTAVPRITIAQKLDVLSSQAKVAGHRAVIEATHSFGRFHTAEMTAAGKFPPSQTFVLGCGVAGLAAIGTSKALGSVVRAWDVRDVSDQVHSMGAKWVTVDFKEDGAGQGGYAKESSNEFKRAQHATFSRVLKEIDVVITTAAIPGRPSPLLITKEAVAGMKPGSVIVDLAAVGGGNCELTRADEVFTTSNGVTIIGYTDLPARMAFQASSMYAQNMLNLLRHVSGKDKASGLLQHLYGHLDKGEEGDIVTRSIVCCRNGQKVKMPPPPQPTPPKPKAAPQAIKTAARKANPLVTAMFSATLFTVAVSMMLLLGEGISSSLLTTFLLAGAAGYQAVWGVAHALHTPLMSVTNAISGLTAVGGILLLQRAEVYAARGLAMTAIVVSSVNMFGGFVVSQRMLNLFKKPGEKDFTPFMLMPGGVFLAVALTRPELLNAISTVSALLCVAAIGGLAAMSTANAGCKFGMLGVGGTVLAALVGLQVDDLMVCVALLAAGGTLGVSMGAKVSPIALPQTVAAFHSLVGFAAMVTSIGSFWSRPVAVASMENISAVLGDFVGGVTLTGSIIAFGKLNGNLSSKALNLPGKNFLNLGGLLLFVALMVAFFSFGNGNLGVLLLVLVAALACAMGLHLVGSVGGGDMPVCITVLNSYSGWALVAEGFLLKSTALTIVGSLIGFSGAILTKIMCDAMNRDIFNVLFGGINNKPVAKGGDSAPKEHSETSIPAVAEMVANAKEVLVVPGYGMAMAHAQTALGDIAAICHSHKINLKFGVHPVAGRMPGQMNVLLAEAGVPHEWVLEMDEVNPDMEANDLVLVIGANDVVNSSAQEVEGCAIWGMPVIEVWRAKKVIFCKRTMGGGYADLDNPVFYKENTEMLLGDAKKTADSLAAKVRERLEAV